MVPIRAQVRMVGLFSQKERGKIGIREDLVDKGERE